jgi:hypothetical protein
MALTKVKNVLDITADTVADLANVQHKTGSNQSITVAQSLTLA